MNYQFYTLIILYILQAIVIWLTLSKTAQDAVVKQGRNDSFGVNFTRIIVLLSPLIVYFYKPELVNENIQFVLYFLGVLIYFFGLYFYFNARKVLSKNFHSSPVVLETHELVTKGIYSHIRHPIYTSYIINWIGLTLITLNWAFSLVIGLFVLRMIVRIKEEEKVLTKEFGQSYITYKMNSGRLLPKPKYWLSLF